MKRWSMYIRLFFLAITAPLYAQSVNVPLEHWVYDFVDRMQARGMVRNLVLGSRPYSRDDIAEMLAEIEGNVQTGKGSLSATESSVFEQLKGEFHEELAPMNVSSDPRWHERHITTWTEGDHRILGDAIFQQSFDGKWGGQVDPAEHVSQTTMGGSFRGRWKDTFGFFAYATNKLTKGDDTVQESFDPSRGMPVTISGQNAYSDDAAAYLVWKLPWFRMEFGRDQAQWGPGVRGSLMMSSQNPRFDMLRLKVQFRRFRFTSIHGKLSSGLGSKYFAAHRLEITILPWLIVSGSESVVYGNRGIELAYLNPIMPYHVAEHHLGDKDNNAMGLDVVTFPRRNHKVYFELFLDDFTTAENPFTYYGNKFAFLTGWRWVAPLGIADADLQLEYARVEPYVYTHKDSINVYTNYDRSIGHWLGPNSDDLYLRGNYWLCRDFKCAIVAERIRRGEGNIDTPHDISEGTQKRFLSGTVETRWLWGLEMRLQVFKDAFLAFHYYTIDTRNAKRIRGQRTKDHHVFLQFMVNY